MAQENQFPKEYITSDGTKKRTVNNAVEEAQALLEGYYPVWWFPWHRAGWKYERKD